MEHSAHKLSTISTPLQVDKWSEALAAHPDQAFVRYVCDGIRCGFRIGFDRSSQLRSATTNMQSAFEHPGVISQYLQKELSLGRLLGPFEDTSDLPPLQINQFGVIPKGHNTGKWCLLSFPNGQSMNDGIDSALCSLHYTTVEDVAKIIAEVGNGALLAKFDIETAYRLILVHPQDRPLQAMRWEGKTYIDPMLPFGLRSAPKIFNAVADMLNWRLQEVGFPLIRHYLDDYIIITPPNIIRCRELITILHREGSRLGVPIAVHKCDGPTTCITFLGIKIDTVPGISSFSAIERACEVVSHGN